MRLAEGLNPYDILTNMDSIQPQITMRQLLAVALRCRSELSASLVRKHAKIVDVHDISMDPGAPTVDVFIDGYFIQGVQIDSESSVNLMSAETMEELGLTTMTTTPIILRVADQSRIKPLGIVRRVPTLIGGIFFKISYIIFKVSDSLSQYFHFTWQTLVMEI